MSDAQVLHQRTPDEIHQAENFFGRVASFILAGPYIVSTENGEMQIRRDEDLEARKSRYDVQSIFPQSDYGLGFMHGRHQLLAHLVSNPQTPALLEGSEGGAWLLASAKEKGSSDYAMGLVHGIISAARWARGYGWDEPA